MQLLNKLVLVSGASKGLGQQVALQLAEQGAIPYLLARDEALLQSTAEQIKAAGGRCHLKALDLADTTAFASLAQELENLGGLDALINNAGLGYYRPFLEHSSAQHQAMIQLNLTSLVELTYALLPQMLSKESAHIINVGSDLSFTPKGNMAVYTATKFAVRGFSLSLSQEVRSRGVKVSLFNPGIIDTHFNDSQPGSKDPSWALQPEELAKTLIQVLQQPGYQLIDEITIHPQMQDY